MQYEKVKSTLGWLLIGSRIGMILLVIYFRTIEFFDDDTVKLALIGILPFPAIYSHAVLKYFVRSRYNRPVREALKKNYYTHCLVFMIVFICSSLALLIWQGVKPNSLTTFSTLFLVLEGAFLVYIRPSFNDLFNLRDTQDTFQEGNPPI
ncbi:MAG TPA: hypothetical protein VNW04_14100 [Puia sp.]|jgi:hypothetical protein|nr:hypothetical protein [Puia sp.]